MKNIFLSTFSVLVTLSFCLLSGCANTQDLSHYNNDILGLSFDYPIVWGEITSEDKIYTYSISFTNKPEVVLSARYNAESLNAKEKCMNKWSKGGHYDMRQENGEDVYAEHGYFNIGDCEDEFPYLYSVSSDQKYYYAGWVSLDEELEFSNKLNMATVYYFDLESPYFTEMTTSVTAPSIESDEVCLMRITSKCEKEDKTSEEYEESDEETITITPNEPSLSCPLYQNLECINYTERQMALDALKVFNDGAIGGEVEDLLKSMVLTSSENAEALISESYNEAYADLTEHSNDVLGVSFTYPVAFGELDEDSNIILTNAFSIEISTLEDAIAEEEAFYATYDRGPACIGRLLTEKIWQSNYKTFYESDVAEESNNIVQLGENKFLLSSDGRCGDPLTEAKYITFVGDIRFEIRGNTVQKPENFTWMSPYELINHQLRTALIESILKSMMFF